MHIGLIGFLVCIPALVGSTDVAAMRFSSGLCGDLLFSTPIFVERDGAEGMERVE
jgi:hypothetical protein